MLGTRSSATVTEVISEFSATDLEVDGGQSPGHDDPRRRAAARRRRARSEVA